MLITLIDGYTDEPSCLGVPPFIAPYPRYIYGAIKDAGHKLNYLTIDEYRHSSDKIKQLRKSKIMVIYAGAIVPGKYLRGTPISFREIQEIAQNFNVFKIFGGAVARFGFGSGGGKKAIEPGKLSKYFDVIIKGDLDACLYDYLVDQEFTDRPRTPQELSKWAVKGAEIVQSHPDFPQPLIAELEGSKGCVRYFNGGCSFCLEPEYGEPEFRPPQEIQAEVKMLYKLGVRNLRLGAQSCIFSYFAKGVGKTETPTPNPEQIKKLLKGIRSVAPKLKVLHLDNANPAIIAAHPNRSTEIIKLLIEYCTSGNVLSFGLESADPVVKKANNLNATPEEVIVAIRLLNKYGSERGANGMPKLLPGLNFVAGLKGESKATYELNYQFLKSILAEKLLLRRINLRQVLVLKGDKRNEFNTRKYHNLFIKYKSRIRQDIDNEMLKRLVPESTILREVYLEETEGNLTYARQIGTYPILIGIPYKIELSQNLSLDKRFIDITVIDHGYRSVTGIEYPFDINHASLKALVALPGIGKKRASRIIRNRPYKNFDEFQNVMDDSNLTLKLKNYIKI